MCNLNANDECEWRIALGDQCSLTPAWHVLLCGSSVYGYEGVSRLIKHSHSDQSLHAMIHFVIVTVHIRIQTFGRTPILILYFFNFVVISKFVICIRITHEWNLCLRHTLVIAGHSQTFKMPKPNEKSNCQNRSN